MVLKDFGVNKGRWRLASNTICSLIQWFWWDYLVGSIPRHQVREHKAGGMVLTQGNQNGFPWGLLRAQHMAQAWRLHTWWKPLLVQAACPRKTAQENYRASSLTVLETPGVHMLYAPPPLERHSGSMAGYHPFLTILHMKYTPHQVRGWMSGLKALVESISRVSNLGSTNPRPRHLAKLLEVCAHINCPWTKPGVRTMGQP